MSEILEDGEVTERKEVVHVQGKPRLNGKIITIVTEQRSTANDPDPDPLTKTETSVTVEGANSVAELKRLLAEGRAAVDEVANVA
jgi:hypothetical protein